MPSRARARARARYELWHPMTAAKESWNDLASRPVPIRVAGAKPTGSFGTNSHRHSQGVPLARQMGIH